MKRFVSQISAIRGQFHVRRLKSTKGIDTTITYDQIPTVYLPSYGNGKIDDIFVATTFDHEEFFNQISKEAIPLFLNVFHVLQDISENEEKYSYEEGIKLEFHNQLTSLLSSLPFAAKNHFSQENVEVIKLLFEDLKWARNVITLTNLLQLNSSNTFKVAIRNYFQEIWRLQLAAGSEDFLRDVLSAVLRIWEIKVVDATTT